MCFAKIVRMIVGEYEQRAIMLEMVLTVYLKLPVQFFMLISQYKLSVFLKTATPLDSKTHRGWDF